MTRQPCSAPPALPRSLLRSSVLWEVGSNDIRIMAHARNSPALPQRNLSARPTRPSIPVSLSLRPYVRLIPPDSPPALIEPLPTPSIHGGMDRFTFIRIALAVPDILERRDRGFTSNNTGRSHTTNHTTLLSGVLTRMVIRRQAVPGLAGGLPSHPPRMTAPRRPHPTRPR